MPISPLRKVRTHVALRHAMSGAHQTLPPGEWFVEQLAVICRVFGDAAGARHVADVNLIEFLDGLATRQIVFVSWG
jgi:hypothetical protein